MAIDRVIYLDSGSALVRLEVEGLHDAGPMLTIRSMCGVCGAPYALRSVDVSCLSESESALREMIARMAGDDAEHARCECSP